MSRTRTLTELIADVRQRADVESASARHPDSDITRYVNQGGAALRDLIMEVRGRRYFRASTPIEVEEGVSVYPLPADFQSLLLVRTSTFPGEMLSPWEPQDEAWLRDTFVSTTNRPCFYDLKAGNIEFLPVPREGITIILEYIPRYDDLTEPGHTLEGYDGWEEYAVVFAALNVATKDDESDLIRTLKNDLAVLEQRIRKMAVQRDRFRAERVKDSRGDGRPLSRFWPYRRWGGA